ncbi:hypothetical protein ACGFI3_46280 [Nonomuraea wenchangensis]|uniref:hypothetical protein n=1 Tax=Nonomuraea wenchangensis TaxID=568860 RepID=UPI00371368A5
MEELWVEQSLVGSGSSVEFRGCTCTVSLPERPVNMGDHEFGVLGGYVDDRDGQRIKTAYKYLPVYVEIPSDLTADQFPATELPTELRDRTEELYRTGAQIASELATQYVRWLRVLSGQSSIGPSNIKLSDARAVLFDKTGERIPLGFISMPGARGRLGEAMRAATPANHDTALLAAAEGNEPPLAEALLADAEYLTTDAVHPDVRLGVLLAAIACEVKVKEAITEVAQPSQIGLIDVIVKHHQQVHVPAVVRFHLLMDAICQRSLQRENSALYTRVEKLFAARNKIAHIGHKTLEPGEDLQAHVKTAQDAFAWLNSIITEHGQTQAAENAR